MLEDLGASSLKMVRQIHSNLVYTVDNIDADLNNIEADALVTDLPGVALAVIAADCVPILFVDSKNKVIGVAHAGWSGALSGVIENTVKAMQNLGSKTESVQALIGPCIHQESYEVSQEFYDRFIEENIKNKEYFLPLSLEGKYLFDLVAYVKNRLNRSRVGVIYDMDHNTFARPSLYSSNRRSTLCGQSYQGSLLSTIMIK